MHPPPLQRLDRVDDGHRERPVDQRRRCDERLGYPPYDPNNPESFGCGGCHVML